MSCEHSDSELVNIVPPDDFQKCIECGKVLVANEIEIIGMFYEVGGFCDNKDCKRYMLLVA